MGAEFSSFTYERREHYTRLCCLGRALLVAGDGGKLKRRRKNNETTKEPRYRPTEDDIQ